ncbi:chalcone-flavanone isomerase-domain-containing protein [Vararia minispora EC-137]|uniref:Chalcone-flavanone isomerase-domain-containing protein n=1 Tax=Vararia minispora EC-137 TaxID=1314806 RepID=A0ACB8QT28_9AGAM|nr:chalcone-flavanone isomerase-domain-containing protein [Vararia minispora EC-137]
MSGLHAVRRTVAFQFGRRTFATVREAPSFRFAKPLLWGTCFTLPAAFALWNAISLDTEPVSDSVVDPDTSIQFPKHLRVQSQVPLPMYSLLGCGCRTVSFLGIKVYSVGFYADMTNPRLKDIPKSATPEEKIKFIVDNTTCLLRIVPTRNTSYSHLRDAFIRTLNGRMQKNIQDKVMTIEDATTEQSPITKLKSMFPNSKFAKYEPLEILVTPPDISQPRTLIVRDLGTVSSTWVATTLFMSYFEGLGLSPPMKDAVWKTLKGVGRD